LGLRALLGWEFRNLVRFPLLELLVFIAVYLSMITAAGGTGMGMTAQSEWSMYPSGIAETIMRHSLNKVESLYLATIFTITVFASVGIAREVEAGYVKVALSAPIRRRDLFLVKFASCFLTGLAIFAFALFSAMFLRNWPSALYIVSYPPTLLMFFVLLLVQTFYVAGVATAMAVFSKSTAASFIGSIGIMYVPVYMAQTVAGLSIPFIPPQSTRLFAFYIASSRVFWKQYDLLTLMEATAIPVLIASVLLLASFVYFTRRFDLS